jgi:hypothetical protein
MLRLAEGLVTVTAQQRALLHDVVSGARALSEASAWMGRLAADVEKGEGEGGEGRRVLVLPAQVCVRKGNRRMGSYDSQ